jgi:hypothetical protein
LKTTDYTLKKIIVILLVLLIGTTTFLGVVLLLNSSETPQNATTHEAPKPPANLKKDWSAEEIAADPEGYLVYSSQQVQEQIAAREKRLEMISSRRGELSTRRDELMTKMDEVANFRKRLEAAYRRAADEDRWPVRMAGRTFDRDRVQAILNETQQWLDDRTPLADAYATSFKKMDESAQALRNDIRSLNQLRERVVLDIERVKLNQGNAELDQLRKNESQLASMSQTLTQMSDEQTPQLSNTSKTANVDIDAILK